MPARRLVKQVQVFSTVRDISATFNNKFRELPAHTKSSTASGRKLRLLKGACEGDPVLVREVLLNPTIAHGSSSCKRSERVSLSS